MRKSIKYGLVAGITMASFCIAPIPATYGSGAGFVCGDTINTEAGTELTVDEGATSCAVKATFETAPENVGALTIGGGFTANDDYAVTLSGATATVTLNATGIAKAVAAEGGLALSISDGVQTFQTTIVKTPEETLSSINATISKSELAYNETAQITVTPDVAGDYTYTYTVEPEGIATVSSTGVVTMVDDSLTDDVPVVVTVGVEGHAGITKEVSFTAKAAETTSQSQVTILSGDGQTWNKGSSQGMTFRVDAPVEEVIDVAIWRGDWDGDDFEAYDMTMGGLVEGENIFLSSGSTILTFSPDFLNTLTQGEWNWEIVFANGMTMREAVGTFTIAGAVSGTTVTTASATSNGISKVGSPKTGAGVSGEEADGVVASGMISAIVAVVSMAALGAFAFIRKNVTRK